MTHNNDFPDPYAIYALYTPGFKPQIVRLALLLMLVPDTFPLTPWTAQLPGPLRWKAMSEDWARPAVEQRLRTTGLTLHS